MSEKTVKENFSWNFKVDLNICNIQQWLKCFDKKSVELGKKFFIQRITYANWSQRLKRYIICQCKGIMADSKAKIESEN